MNNIEENIFSEEYSSADTTNTEDNSDPTVCDEQQISFFNQEEYSMSKPKRIIIKAIIKND